MSATGLEVLDRTWHKTHEWVNDLRDRLGWSSDRDALRLLRATLHQIRDRVHVNETAQLSAQLPIMIRACSLKGGSRIWCLCGGTVQAISSQRSNTMSAI